MPEQYALRKGVGPLSSGTRVVIMEDRGNDNLIVRTLTKKEKHSRKTGTKYDYTAIACVRNDLVVLRSKQVKGKTGGKEKTDAV